MKLTGAEIIIKTLIEQGVTDVFGYPGGQVINIYDALYKYRDQINHVLTAHEQGASHAADGYARATGKTGVVIATSGPGATNLVTGIATAYMDSVPMVAITGNVPNNLIGADSFQEVYIAGITLPITKHNFVVRRVEDLADTLRRAFEIAGSGRPGPVLVDIPKDVTAAICEYQPMEAVKTGRSTEIKGNIKEVAKLINNSERPFIYFGGGVRLSEAGEELRQLVETADIPASYTLMAAGVLGYGEKNNLGLIGMHGCYSANAAANRADVMLAIGTRFSDRVALNPDKFGHNARIVHIDIDPGEINKNIIADYSIVGDVKEVLTELLKYVKPAKRDAWHEQIARWKQDDYKPEPSETELKPHYLIEKACEIAGKDAVYVTDVGQHQMWAAQFLHHTHPRNFLTSGGLGTMGYGYGAAIGAKIARGKDTTVVHFTGDGSFHMNMNEICTAVSYGVHVITVIFNNSVLGMVRQWQGAFYDRRFSSSEPERITNYKAVAEGFGGHGFRCETPAEFEAAMKQALEMDGPVWIECIVDREEKVLPMIPGGKTVHDTIFK